MTLASDRTRVDYRCNGSKTQFPIPFRYLDVTHLAVTLLNTDTNVETIQLLDIGSGGDYTVSVANRPQGGTLTMASAPASNRVLTIIRDVPYDQLINFRENDAFSANRNEFAFDKLTMLLQQTDESIRRGVLLKATTNLDEVDVESLYPEKGGFTSIFPAQLTALSVAPNLGACDFVEQRPIAGGLFEDRPNGLDGVAWPLPHCLVGWESDLPLYVMIHVHKDDKGELRYIFSPPPPCNIESVTIVPS